MELRQALPGTLLPASVKEGGGVGGDSAHYSRAANSGKEAVVAWHGALSLSDLQGVNTTCHYQLSALAASDS